MENIRDVSMFCENQKSLVIFPKKVLLEEAQKTCKIYGGDIVVPNSDQESKQLLNIVSKHKKSCTINSNAQSEHAVWLGAKKVNHKWYHLSATTSQSNLLNYSKAPYKKSNANSPCSYLINDGSWTEANPECE